ncbi:hypothetical protein I6F20_37355 [Bradyrhizobium sp. IC3123]|nr:hypothetical protein [Bradyrhizobium sp. IC3123]
MEPALQAVEKFGSDGADDLVTFYQSLVSAWESGGRPAALIFLAEQRDATLSRLKMA